VGHRHDSRLHRRCLGGERGPASRGPCCGEPSPRRPSLLGLRHAADSPWFLPARAGAGSGRVCALFRLPAGAQLRPDPAVGSPARSHPSRPCPTARSCHLDQPWPADNAIAERGGGGPMVHVSWFVLPAAMECTTARGTRTTARFPPIKPGAEQEVEPPMSVLYPHAGVRSSFPATSTAFAELVAQAVHRDPGIRVFWHSILGTSGHRGHATPCRLTRPPGEHVLTWWTTKAPWSTALHGPR